MSAPSEAKEEVAAPIDPRLRARRIAVRRDVGRRRLHRFAALGIVVAVLGAVVALALSPLLDVDEVTVTGAFRVPPREVVAASGVQPGDQLVLVDRPGVVAQVERLPWVRTASVERSWPSTLQIAVVEREPLVGFVGSDGRLVLADEEGRVLDVVAAGEAGPGVIVITGPASPGTPGRPVTAPARPALEVARALPPEVADRVGEVAVEDDGTLTLLLEPLAEGAGPGPRVVLGDDLALDEKVSALATILARVDLAGVVTVDLQVPGAPALTRR